MGTLGCGIRSKETEEPKARGQLPQWPMHHLDQVNWEWRTQGLVNQKLKQKACFCSTYAESMLPQASSMGTGTRDLEEEEGIRTRISGLVILHTHPLEQRIWELGTQEQVKFEKCQITAATASVNLKVSPKSGRPAATEVKIPNPRGRPKIVKQPCPSESDMFADEVKSKKKGQVEKQPEKQLKKEEEGQKEEDKPRKEPDKKEGKKEVESKRKKLPKTGVASASGSEQEGDDQEGEKKRKGGRNFQTVHRRNMLKGQHEKEAADGKRKQEEQMETEHQTACNLHINPVTEKRIQVEQTRDEDTETDSLD
uniref:PC4 and SFRS1-interacting protein-like n=1 Tax=Jaculus jaculus TaxID=51337 RepID=UPI001E1B25BB|nr:PC4 and SFRS1-interacting protein-like [Jaculus jaculus]